MKKKILIIEDEIDLIKVLKDTFEKENFQVFCAEDGEEGIEKFYEKNPDLILLDINMPKKNGWEVCKEVREQSNIPIVMMTARDSEIDELKGLNIGADDYITKPFNTEEFLARVDSLIRRYNILVYNSNYIFSI